MSILDLPQTASPGSDAPAGQDELGRTVYRTVTGELYTMPERPQMPAPTMTQRLEGLGGLASRAYENLSVENAIETAKGIGGGILSGLVQGFTAPGRALSGEPVTMGDVMATAGMVQGGAAPMRAPEGSLRSGSFRVYHGSPHDFDKFSLDKIGTGEGAQAYGHGLYFAENEGIARGYRDALSARAAPNDARGNAFDLVQRMGGDVDATAELLRDSIPTTTSPNTEQFLRETLKHIEDGTYADFERPLGSMYEVNINADPADFLDWDKPLSEQSPRVQDVLGQFGMKYDEAASNDFDNALLAALFDDAPGPLPKQPINPTGNDIYMRSTLRNFAVQDDAGRWGPGASTYDESLAAAGGDPKRVRAISTGSAPDRSEALRRAGIPGIRYLDAGSRGAGDGSRNYVVFDENLISIVRKYGIAGAAAMLGVSAVDVEQALADNLPQSQWDQLVVGPK